MIKFAVRELRHRPRRLFATWAGIALSVGFLVSTQILANTELAAMAKADVLEARQADIVVAVPPSDSGGEINAAALREAVHSLDAAEVSPLLATLTTVGKGSNARVARVTAIPDSDSLRAGSLTSGAWPTAPDQFVTSAHDAQVMGLELGDDLDVEGTPITLVGLTDDPHSVLDQTVTVRMPMAGFPSGDVWQWIVAAPPQMSVTDAVDKLNAELASRDAGPAQAMPLDQYLDDLVASMMGGVNPLEVVANAFGALSLVVGTIMVSTTFAILLAQRRRQIALMRMIGASTRQVRRGLLIEAILVGAIGAVLGVAVGFGAALAVSALSGSLGFGLIVPWAAVAVAFGLGVLATVIAAWVPVRRAMRVSPMEAIRDSALTQTRTHSTARVIGCLVAVLAGIGATVATFFAAGNAFPVALGAGVVLSVGILASSPLFVPPLLRGLGAVVRRWGPIPRLAVSNATRNASRSAATATALMLAVGLVVMLQVATATTKAAAQADMNDRYPLDVSVTALTGPLPEQVIADLQGAPGVADSAVLAGAPVSVRNESLGGNLELTMLEYSSGVGEVLKVPADVSGRTIKAGYMLFGPDEQEAELVLGNADGTQLTVQAELAEYLGPTQILVGSDTFDELAMDSAPTAVWMRAEDLNDPAPLSSAVSDVVGTGVEFEAGGSLIYAAILWQVLDGLLIVATILAAVAIVIALIGVGNTLGLSVLERTRESALLRALGLQRRGLRASLTVEALLIGVVGVAVGVAVGVWFGWFAAAALSITSEQNLPPLTIDPLTTGVLTVVALAAAVASSVLPGRRAAMATPVEALADVD